MLKSNQFKNSKPVIAIDGTAGSGKGTLAKSLSLKLGFDHLDTGILYRICAYEIKIKNKEISGINISNYLNDKKILNRLRSDEISKFASIVSKDIEIRKYLLKFQRNFADFPPNKLGSVIDGRDIGSIVVPNADLKFYIDASAEIRAKRRLQELKLDTSNYREILENIIKRDKQDKSREISPLIKTNDCHLIETSTMNREEVFNLAIDILKKNTEFIK